MVLNRGDDSGSIFLSKLRSMEGVYRCLGVFRGILNTVEIYNHSDLFRFDAPRRGVLKCLLGKKGEGRKLKLDMGGMEG